MSELVLTLRQHAQLGVKSRQDNVLGTMEHIPGSSVRGALAAVWLVRNGISRPDTPKREEFLRLFEGGVRYGALLRPGTEFMSLAVFGHKYAPGPGCRTVDYDRALGQEPPTECGQCGSPIEQRKGLHGKRKAPVRRTSVAMGDDGTATDGALFTRETLAPGQEFRGTVTGPGDALAVLADLKQVRVGGRRTTHGLADVTIRPGGGPPLPEVREDGLLVVRLRSPGIFTDDYGRPSRDPSAAELTEALGGNQAQVRDRWTRWEQAGGWHVASGLPKPQELAVAAGSTYLVHTERVPADSELAAFSARGLGLRRHEGFGDLAPPPVLREGADSRETANRHQQALKIKAAPLNRLLASRAGAVVRQKMAAHANGDATAAPILRRAAAGQGDDDVRRAVEAFLALPAGDAAYLAEELGR